jgi:UDP-glucose 6-dehydrogenase
VLGLTFKPNTDDMRDAPSLVILPYLQKAGATIRAYDPEGCKEAAKHMQLDYRKSTYDALEGADGVFRSTDEGATWKRLNDDKHQFGTVHQVLGDPKLFGRVYVAAEGRGILYATME